MKAASSCCLALLATLLIPTAAKAMSPSDWLALIKQAYGAWPRDNSKVIGSTVIGSSPKAAAIEHDRTIEVGELNVNVTKNDTWVLVEATGVGRSHQPGKDGLMSVHGLIVQIAEVPNQIEGLSPGDELDNIMTGALPPGTSLLLLGNQTLPGYYFGNYHCVRLFHATKGQHKYYVNAMNWVNNHDDPDIEISVIQSAQMWANVRQ